MYCNGIADGIRGWAVALAAVLSLCQLVPSPVPLGSHL